MPDPVVDQTLHREIVPNFRGGAITMVRGKARRFRFQVVDRLTRAPVDITAWSSFTFMGKNEYTDPDLSAVVTKSLGFGITKVSASSGVIEILLSPSDTSGLDPNGVQLFAEQQGVDPAGLPWAVWQGELDIQPHVIEASV